MKTKATIILIFFASLLSAQCDVTKCVGESLVLNHTTTASNPTFFWQAPLAFTGQGTGVITFAALPQGNFQAILQITDGLTGCTSSDTINVCVNQDAPSLVLPEICADAPCIPVSGGSSAGTYTINGVPITQLCATDAGQVVTFTSSGNCPGTATATFNVLPLPTVIIVPN